MKQRFFILTLCLAVLFSSCSEFATDVSDDDGYSATDINGHYGLPNPIVNFRHKNVLRTAATDIFGDMIPAVSTAKGTTWEKEYTLNAAGYNMNHARVIAFVLFDTNAQNRKGVLNVQIARAGETKNFD